MFELSSFYSLSEIESFNIQYVSLVSKYKGKWVIVHHSIFDKWDCPGGRIEHKETPIEAAKRELWEETGALEAVYNPLFIYSIETDNGISYGIQYFVEIKEIGPLPKYEMDKVEFVDELPFEKMRTPEVHRRLTATINIVLSKGIQ